MIYKYLFTLLVWLLLATACHRNPKDDGTMPATLFPQPISIPANPEGGYILNPLTGDSIRPIINSLGDTVRTGIPIPVQGRRIHLDSVGRPTKMQIGPLETLVKQEVHSKEGIDLENIPSSQASLSNLKTVKWGEGDQSFVLVGIKGDTIPTGVPLPAQSKAVKAPAPIPKKALPSAVKEAARTNLKYLDIDQGLGAIFVRCINQDKQGNLWISTSGGGVSVYDGISFRNFTEKEGLLDKSVWATLQDSKGNIWIGTTQGLCLYNGAFFSHFSETKGLDSKISAIFEDSKGRIWFAARESVCVYDGIGFTHLSTKEGLSSNKILCIIEDKNQNIWFGTNENGVCMYDGTSFLHVTEKDGLPDNSVLSMLADKNGVLWFGTRKGLCRYDGKNFQTFAEKEGLKKLAITALREDSHGNLWIGMRDGGVCRYDGISFTHFTTKEGLSNNVVSCILEDDFGNLWVGTLGGGINMLNPNSFNHLSELGGILAKNKVWSIIEDTRGNIWIGTEGGGLNIYDGFSIKQITEKEGLPAPTIWSTMIDQNKHLWFGTNGGGVLRYDGKDFFRFTTEEGLPNNTIWTMKEDKDGNIWFGGEEQGISKYDGKEFTHFTEKEGLSNSIVWCTATDRKGNLWFGTDVGGITKYDGKHFTHYTEKEGLSNNKVFSIREDRQGNLWIGTGGGGICIFDGTHFTTLTEKEGLSHSVVWSITEDKNGNMWASTLRGLNQVVVQMEDEKTDVPERTSGKHLRYFIKSYQKEDGLKNISFFLNSACLDSKSQLWWGGNQGLSSLDMNRYSPSLRAPSVFLKQVDIKERYFDFHHQSDNLPNGIQCSGAEPYANYPLGLVLPYDQNHLGFHYAGIDWSAPHKIKYSFRMLGLNNQWSQPTPETKADYRNLPYGNYTLQIRAAGESGIWGEALNYSFTINPPWWHTWWARLGYGIIAMLLVIGYTRWRTSTLKKRQKKLEAEILEATYEIREQKKKIEQEKEHSEILLLNILPQQVADELKNRGVSEAQMIEKATVLFTDFKGFTGISEVLSAQDLVADLNHCFTAFDEITQKYHIEKIKTIGDAYMAAGGVPTPNASHAKDVVLAALDIRDFIDHHIAQKRAANQPFFEIRIGIHSGPLVAGIVGVRKFQYDIWGDTVNTAARVESTGEVGKINISQSTYELLKNEPELRFERRGKIKAKGKGEIEMYFVERIVYQDGKAPH